MCSFLEDLNFTFIYITFSKIYKNNEISKKEKYMPSAKKILNTFFFLIKNNGYEINIISQIFHYAGHIRYVH